MSKFGSTKAVHLQRAKRWAVNTRTALKAAARSLKHDNCQAALRALITASRFQARMISEKVGANRKSRGDGLGGASHRAVSRLESKFAKACVR